MTDKAQIVSRITSYLSLGGLWNPELAEHNAVRELLIECREALSRPEAVPLAWKSDDPENFYCPHPLQIDSGTFWRCKHGRTGFGSGLVYLGCEDCKKEATPVFAPPATPQPAGEAVGVGRVSNGCLTGEMLLTAAGQSTAFKGENVLLYAAPPADEGSEERIAARQSAIREHDYPIYRAFHAKHGMPSKLPPSCLVCGQSQPERDEWAIQHMELPNIIVCSKCRSAAALAEGKPA